MSTETIKVTRCGNCPAFDFRDRCLRLNMTMYEQDPPCNWAITGKKPEDFIFTEEDTRELQELTKRHQPDYYEERSL